jgi:four helix bundle protein
MEIKQKIQSFTDLNAWKESHKLVLIVYKTTKKFPKEETFILNSQLCRAAISITSNIAEGFSRNSSKEKSQFYSISLGSLTEVQSQLLLAKDLNYINQEEFLEMNDQITTVNKLIHGLLKTVSNHYT